MARKNVPDKMPDGPAQKEPPDKNWVAFLVGPLWLVYVSNQWSRASLYSLVDFSDTANAVQAMNVALNFDQTQYGVLASLAFTVLFAVASVGAGAAADRYNRKTLTLGATLGWTVATLGTAIATSYIAVLGWRIAMGLACAVATPTAYTLIRERVPSTKVALASSIYGSGVAVASALASLTILLDNTYGWRTALLVVTTCGAVALVTATLLLSDDPVENKVYKASSAEINGKSDAESVSGIWNDLQIVIQTPGVSWILTAAVFRFSAGLCIGVWGAPYFRLAFPDRQDDFAITLAVISAVCATISGILGGATADALVEKANLNNSDDATSVGGRRLWVPVVGSLLAAPTWYFAVQSQQATFEVAMAWLALEYFVAECWFGPTISTLQSSVPPRVGGTAQGAFTLAGAIANVAPSWLGYAYSQATTSTMATTITSDNQAMVDTSSSAQALADLLAVGVCLGYIVSAVCFAVAATQYPSTSLAQRKQK